MWWGRGGFGKGVPMVTPSPFEFSLFEGGGDQGYRSGIYINIINNICRDFQIDLQAVFWKNLSELCKTKRQ